MWWEYLRIAQKVLRTHKFRSFLTVLSITIGAFSIVVMSSLAESGLTTLAKGIEDLGGARLIEVVVKQPERQQNKTASYAKGMTRADREVVFGALPHVVAKSTYTPLGRRDVVGDSGVSGRTDLVLGDGGFLKLFQMKLASGRGFTDEESLQRAKVCVVGHKLAKKLWDDADPLGRWMTVQGVRCRVIGRLVDQERWGIHMGFDWLDVAVMPIDTLAEIDPTVMQGAGIILKTDDQGHNEIVKRIVNALLSERHHGVDDFEIFDFSTFMDKFNAVFSTMKAIVGFIAGIALLVGGIGVMNMMLVSVSERVREIGIRKAIGASPQDISAQFLWEAVVLAGSGGLLGVVTGIGGAALSGWVIGLFNKTWVSVIAQRAVVTALVVSVVIGLVFGYFPARRAGRLSAIEAIRR